MKVTTTLHAYLSPHSSLTPQALQTEEGARQLSYFGGTSTYWAERGYTYIGLATVELEVPDERALLDSKVEALREEIAATRAESTAKITRLESQIQNLLALDYTPAPDASTEHPEQ